MSSKRTLFVSGVARSGTTILSDLLNTHSHVCLGVERFKFQYLVHKNFDPNLFSKDRFFSFQDDDTNLRPNTGKKWEDLYHGLSAKWDRSLIVGDKIPDLTAVLGRLLQVYPGSRFLFILRDPASVAASWQARSENKRDVHWPENKNFQQAFDSWERQHEIMARHLTRAHFRRHVMILDYNTMFFRPNDRLAEQLEDFLEVPHDAAFRVRLDDLVRRNRERAHNPEERLPREALDRLESLNRGPFEDLKAMAA